MKRTQACAITHQTKEIVWKRDNCECIFCGRWVPVECACAHVVNRSQGGLGIPENIVTACYDCHREMDNGRNSLVYRREAQFYLKQFYAGWNPEMVKYRKGQS